MAMRVYLRKLENKYKTNRQTEYINTSQLQILKNGYSILLKKFFNLSNVFQILVTLFYNSLFIIIGDSK